MDFIEKNKKPILAFLLVLNVFVFSQTFLGAPSGDLRLYFLNVGQGDSQLVILPGGVKVLIDGGSTNGAVFRELDKVLKPTDRYIDLVVMTHPQLDHFGGLIDVLKRYRVGAFITNGRSGEAKAFLDLAETLKRRKTRIITLIATDKIRYRESIFNVLSPTERFLADKELNNSSLVLHLAAKNSTALFTSDIGFNVENNLLNILTSEVDILKVAHHGSKYSSSANFLDILSPKVAVIGVGKNSYGHPTAETLQRLSAVGARMFRTDKDGTVEIVIDDKSAKISKGL